MSDPCYRIVWSQSVHERYKTLDLGNRNLFWSLHDQLQKGEFSASLALRPQPTAPTKYSTKKTTLIGRYPPAFLNHFQTAGNDDADVVSVLYDLARLNVETAYLNPEVPLWCVLWTMWPSSAGVDEDDEERRGRAPRQEIRLWALCPLRKLDATKQEVVARLMKTRDADLLRACLERSAGGSSKQPLTVSEEIVSAADAASACVQIKFFASATRPGEGVREPADDLHANSAQKTTLPSGEIQEWTRTIIQGDENISEATGVCLELSRQQHIVVAEPGPLLLKGRSGTGKTTLLQHRALRQQEQGTEEQLALFLTASPFLARALDKRFRQLAKAKQERVGTSSEGAAPSANTDGPHGGMISSIAPPHASFAATGARRTLFLTYIQFLQMLDGSIPDGTPFFVRSSSAPVPLGLGDRLAGSPSNDRLLAAPRRPEDEVRFVRFVRDFWEPKLRHMLPAKKSSLYHPHDVYREILVLKGMLVACKGEAESETTPNRYIATPPPDSAQTSFGAEERSVLVKLHDRYAQMLAEQPHRWDMLDACSSIKKRSGAFSRNQLLNPLLGRGFVGRSVNALFCDEAQDLLPQQIELFGVVLGDEARGLTFACDAAQCIAHGRSFRAETLKDIVYGASVGAGAPSPLREISLLRNYRTHQSVLRFSSLVLEMLSETDPQFAGSQEMSPLTGESPVFVCGVAKVRDFVRALGLLDGPRAPRGDGEGRELEEHLLPAPDERKVKRFGADQVILVRSERDRRRVRSSLAAAGGDSTEGSLASTAVILTGEECKGLEFADVIIWNYFSGSVLVDDAPDDSPKAIDHPTVISSEDLLARVASADTDWLQLYEILNSVAEQRPDGEMLVERLARLQFDSTGRQGTIVGTTTNSGQRNS